MKYDVIRCPSGSVSVVECERTIRIVHLHDGMDDPEPYLIELLKNKTTLKKCKLNPWVYEWFKAYQYGKPPIKPSFKLAPEGTEFQLRVWNRTLEIPFGEVLTYGQLAAEIGCASAQAVGQAMGRNPIPIIIPCHRVIAANMHIGGFSSGLENKIRLLRHESWTINNSCIIKT